MNVIQNFLGAVGFATLVVGFVVLLFLIIAGIKIWIGYRRAIKNEWANRR